MSLVTTGGAAVGSGALGVPTKHILLTPGSSPSEHATVTAAVAAAIFGDVITLKGGEFTEDFTVPDGITVEGSPGSCVIGTVTVTGGAKLRRFGLKVTAAGNGIYITAAASTNIGLVEDITVIGQGSGTGIYIGGSQEWVVRGCRFDVGTLTVFINAGGSTSGRITECAVGADAVGAGGALFAGDFLIKDCVFLGACTNSVAFSGGTNTLTSCVTDNATSAGIKISGGTLEINCCEASGAIYGLQVSGAATLDVKQSHLAGGTTDLYVDPAAAGSILYLSGCDYSTSSIPSALRESAEFQSSKFSRTEGERGLHIHADMLAIGDHYKSSEFWWGEGEPHDDLFVLSNTNLEIGTWADHTTAAKSFSGSPFATFPVNTAGACLYVGSTDVKFPAMQMIVPTACTGAGAVVFEGWTGAAWVTMQGFSASAVGALDWVANDPISNTGNQNFRVGDYVASISTAPVHEWDRLVSVTINSTFTGYIYRWRLVTPYTGLGTIEQILTINHCGKQSQYGREYFGNLIKQVEVTDWVLSNLAPVDGATPAVRDLPFSSGSSPDAIILNNNYAFTLGQLDALGQILDLPHWVDPSRGMQLIFRWVSISTNSGDVNMEVRHVLQTDGAVTTDTAPSSPEAILTTVDGTLNKLYKSIGYGGVFGFSNTAQLGLTLTRDAGSAPDTLTGNIVCASTKLFMGKYRD